MIIVRSSSSFLCCSFQQLTKDSNCGSGFCWSSFICHCTFVHWSIIFSRKLCQIKSLCCRQSVSLLGPCNVGLWITGGITEQDGSNAFYNLISWWSRVNCRGNWKTVKETCGSVGHFSVFPSFEYAQGAQGKYLFIIWKKSVISSVIQACQLFFSCEIW